MVSNASRVNREVVKVVAGRETSDGAGVRLFRSLGGPGLPDLDPFLLLDEFRNEDAADYMAGFPDHPHRGFETVTYMLAGHMLHKDSTGRQGHLKAGGIQWMTAARGIIHSEMPQQEEGLMWGFQLWINLPAHNKMDPPRYQEFDPEQLAHVDLGQVGEARVVAGLFQGVVGPVSGIAIEPLFVDLSLKPNAQLEQAIPRGHTAFVYVFEGKGSVGGHQLDRGKLAVLGKGSNLMMAADKSGMRLLLLAGRPLGEPIAKHGPFVMNTREEIHQAFLDYQRGSFAS